MKLELNENDMMLATILMLAGAVAIMALKSMEMITIAQIPPTTYYAPTPYRAPTPHTLSPPVKLLEESPKPKQPETTINDVQTETTINDVQKREASKLSPVTQLGYNANDDLVAVLKRLPNGEVVRRKIRDPDMQINDLKVARWVEYNDWEKEFERDWI